MTERPDQEAFVVVCQVLQTDPMYERLQDGVQRVLTETLYHMGIVVNPNDQGQGEVYQFQDPVGGASAGESKGESKSTPVRWTIQSLTVKQASCRLRGKRCFSGRAGTTLRFDVECSTWISPSLQ